MKFPRRLRSQLTLSHLLATAFTLLSMIAAVVIMAGLFLPAQSGDPRQPGADARNVSGVIGGLVLNHADPAELNAVLHGLADGNLRMTVGLPDSIRRGQPFEFGLSDVAYIVVLDPSGGVMASSDPAGAGFAPPERAEWTTLAATRTANGTTRVRSGAGPVAFGAAPVVSDTGEKLATVVVAAIALPPQPAQRFDAVRGLTIFGVASIVVLAAASVFALLSSFGVAILLSGRLVRRLERLGGAAESLARGDLSQRVEPGPEDEVGQLARRFNRMAADMERTLGELRAERDRVAGLLDDRRQLVASASHELRTPVATVRGYLESALAQPESLPGELRADLETMEREISRLQQLIEDLFVLSQVAVGRLSLRLEPVDAGDLVERLVETAAPLAWRQRRVQVIAEVGQAVPQARSDRQRLEQILSNLLGNAVRHTPPGGLVALAVSGEADAVRLEVRDTGEGIRAEDIPYVFERFFRGRSQHGEGGAGLGLALVKELTEAMDGRVEAESTPGEGSCFTVRLPRA